MIERLNNTSLSKLSKMIDSRPYPTFIEMLDARQDEIIRQLTSYNELEPKIESDDILRGRFRELNWIVLELSKVKDELRRRMEESGDRLEDLDNHDGSQ